MRTNLQDDFARRGHNRGGPVSVEDQGVPDPPPPQHGKGPV